MNGRVCSITAELAGIETLLAGSQTTYANLHGKELAKHIADIGTVDIYWMLIPKSEQGLPGFAGASLFCTGINKSDYYAITATIETIGDRHPHMGRTRIKPDMYTSEKIRKAVKTLWANSLDERPTPTYSREETLEYAKTIV
eukprot:6198486-Pleurochrysis_carterae.AAC.2